MQGNPMSACPERTGKIAVNPAQERLLLRFLRNGFLSAMTQTTPLLHRLRYCSDAAAAKTNILGPAEADS